MILNYQYARHSHNESEDFGAVTAGEALTAFDEFDWVEESERAEKIQKCAPTLSLVSEPKKLMIWVSSYKAGGGLQFVSESLFPGEVTSLFGLMKRQGIVSLHTDRFSSRQARDALELFVAGNYNSLRSLYDRA